VLIPVSCWLPNTCVSSSFQLGQGPPKSPPRAVCFGNRSVLALTRLVKAKVWLFLRAGPTLAFGQRGCSLTLCRLAKGGFKEWVRGRPAATRALIVSAGCAY